MKMRIAIDAMGGDYAPAETVKGGILASREYESDCDILLIGDRDTINDLLTSITGNYPSIEIIHSSQTIGMSESPTKALKNKPNSSIAIGNALQRDGEVDAFVSMGNTGAMFASSLMSLGRIKGVSRPTIGSFMPTEERGCAIFDVGANLSCRPSHLLQFAVMGSIYVDHIFGWKEPKVGLLNIGSESSKGNDLTLEANALLSKSLPNFHGNIEGTDILRGTVDIVICDGFVGNILLKFAESVYDLMKSKVQLYLSERPLAKVGAAFMAPALKQLKKDLDYQEYGGVPLLGVNGVSIIGHGHSSALAIKNAVGVALKTGSERINQHIKSSMEELSLSKTESQTEPV